MGIYFLLAGLIIVTIQYLFYKKKINDVKSTNKVLKNFNTSVITNSYHVNTVKTVLKLNKQKLSEKEIRSKRHRNRIFASFKSKIIKTNNYEEGD